MIVVQEQIVNETNRKDVNRFWMYLHAAPDKSMLNKQVKPGDVLATVQKVPNMGAHLHLTVATSAEASNVHNLNEDDDSEAENKVLGRTMSPLQAFWEAENGISR